jgi:phosphate transport system substrate-binding protein
MTNTTGRLSRIALFLGLVALLATGCGRDDNDTSGTTTTAAGGGDLSGRIEVDGSSTVGPYTTAAAERFQQANSGVQVTVGVSGTGGGFERFCRGETDISNASRAIKDEEKAACETKASSTSSSRSQTTHSPSS